MASYVRRDIVGGAPRTTLSAGMTSGDAVISLTSGTGWPTGANGNFYVVVDRGNSGEEKVLCASRSGTALTVAASGRGVDGTAAAAHLAGVYVEHVISAVDADEANYAVSKTVAKATAVGQILVVDATNSFAAVQAKTSGQVLLGNGTTLVSQAVTGDVTINGSGVTAIGGGKVATSMIADGSITSAKLAALAVLQANIEAAQQFEAGDLKASARATPTTGWLLCDGSATSRATYATLFAAIGSTYGNGDGSTTFNVPDFRGRMVVGAGTGSGLTARSRGAIGGEEAHQLISAEMPSHTHTQNAHNHTATTTAHVTSQGSGAGQNGPNIVFTTGTVTVANATAVNQNTGGDGTHNTMAPFGVANMFIKT